MRRPFLQRIHRERIGKHFQQILDVLSLIGGGPDEPMADRL